MEKNPFDQVELVPGRRTDPDIEKKISQIGNQMAQKGIEVSSWVLEYFADPELFTALTDVTNEKNIEKYIEHTLKFASIVSKERQKRWSGQTDGLFGEQVTLPESEHANGKIRRSESGYKLQIQTLIDQGIDPKHVLFFRASQPSTSPKPEYYWTSDYSETVYGLTQELGSTQRKSAIILVATLDEINKNGGLIQDINDDSGLAVRQINLQPFDQKKAMTKFKHSL